ncbi:AAA family ATPase [Oricola cellulosilytica]|uniref:CtpF protein n=1 Tax=Oricola cellulosilytica TaxID=1429082 RepID=A0A4R0PI55_9HYPH|nr:CpaE family protein [Oricola cellulosilytica]TCD16424.1 CtpF protein [Oricola cellulosilytica]
MSDAAFSEELNANAPDEAGDIASLDDVRPVPRISIQAFCESEGVAAPVGRMGEDRRMAKAQTRVYMGGIRAAVEFYQTAPTPNLIIIETTSSPDALFRDLNDLAEVCDPSTKVVIVGHQNDVTLYRELIRNGISEYIVAPVAIADLMNVVSTLFVDPDADPLGKTVAFVGAKGGVGSSTIAHNVSWAISTLFQSQVVIADMDLPFGTANINFDQDPAQGIAEAVFSSDRIDEVYLDRLLASCAENLSLLAAPSMLDKVYDFDPDAFSQLVDVAQRTAPCVVLDVPHVWNGWTKRTLERADEVVIVAAPELANLRNTKNLIDTLKKLRPNDPAPRLIINQVGTPKRPEIAPDDFAEPLGIEPIAIIPFDAHLFGTASNNGRMLAETDAASPIVANLSDIAHVVTGRGVVREKPKSGLQGILSKLKKK